MNILVKIVKLIAAIVLTCIFFVVFQIAMMFLLPDTTNVGFGSTTNLFGAALTIFTTGSFFGYVLKKLKLIKQKVFTYIVCASALISIFQLVTGSN